MNVLFLMLNCPFDKEREHLYKDLSRKFAEKGHHVYVAALLENRYGKETFVEKDNNHRILWIKAGNYFGVNKFVKGITALLLPFYFNSNINRYFKNIDFDLVIYPTPAVTLYYTVKKIRKRVRKAKYLLVVRDIFPQNALDIGMLKKNLLHKFFRTVEKNLYRYSDYLGCMSEGNIKYLVDHNEIERNKLFILENWSSNLGELQVDDKERSKLLDKYGINGKFVCTFGGNISPANELEFLIELARKVESEHIKDIVFIIIGKGIAKKKIAQAVREHGLTNVKIYDFVPTIEYDQLLQVSDVGLINLNHSYSIPNIPSRSLNLMRLGKPILAATDPNTDFSELIEDVVRCGLWCETGDLETYFENLMKLRQSPELRSEFSRNAREYFLEHLTTERAYQNIMDVVEA